MELSLTYELRKRKKIKRRKGGKQKIGKGIEDRN